MRRDKFDPLEVPNYGFQEAVRYLHVPSSTLEYWTGPRINLLAPEDPSRRLFSFKNLVECYVLIGLREIHGVRVHNIRRALRYLQNKFPSKHPLADYELKTDGRSVYFSRMGQHLDVTFQGQLGLGPVLDTYLRRVERDWGTGKWTLYPFTSLEQLKAPGVAHPKVVSINPNVCFGMPVLSGSRITTAMLTSRYLGGDSVPALATGYGRSEKEIREAISWETGKQEAA